MDVSFVKSWFYHPITINSLKLNFSKLFSHFFFTRYCKCLTIVAIKIKKKKISGIKGFSFLQAHANHRWVLAMWSSIIAALESDLKNLVVHAPINHNNLSPSHDQTGGPHLMTRFVTNTFTIEHSGLEFKRLFNQQRVEKPTTTFVCSYLRSSKNSLVQGV